MERRHGSLIRAARAGAAGKSSNESGARYGLFATLRGGVSTLVDALAARLPAGSIRLRSPVSAITRSADGRWTVELAPPAAGTIDCDAVIVTVSAPQAAALLKSIEPEVARELVQIEYAGTSIVSLAYRREQIGSALDGFGFVVPAVERRRILAGSFSSVKFEDRAPDDGVLVRVFIGGACQPELAELPDDQLRSIACDELRALLHISGEPLFADIARWPRSMPQYHLGHQARVTAIEKSIARVSGLELAGNAYHGVGLPHCIHSGESAAERTLAAIKPVAV
jgi:oxygen-dependent protoporphyrinogen oxidase